MQRHRWQIGVHDDLLQLGRQPAVSRFRHHVNRSLAFGGAFVQ